MQRFISCISLSFLFSAIPQSYEKSKRQEHSTKEVKSQHQFFDQLEDGLPVRCTKKWDSGDCFWTVRLFFPEHMGLESLSSSIHTSITSAVGYHPGRTAQTWKGQRKILKARWANLWRNTSDGVLRGKISVSWAIRSRFVPNCGSYAWCPTWKGHGSKTSLSFFICFLTFFWACFSFSRPI